MHEATRQTGGMSPQPCKPSQARAATRRYPRVRRIAAGCLTALLPTAALTVLTQPVPAHADVSIILDGHGYGHGIGLSQWGAYGYAVDLGWSSAKILDHYYGGTVAGSVPLDTAVSVRLQAIDNLQTAVVSGTGAAAGAAARRPGWPRCAA